MLNLKSIIYRTKAIIDKEGFTSLLKRASTFIIHQIFIYETYYLLENSIKDIDADPDEFVPDIPNLTYKFVKTNQEADKVAVEFSDFRLSHHNARERLDKGAMALCIFIGTDLAYITWTATTEDSKKTFNNIPYKVDFDKNEAVAGGESAMPEYRRKGLSKYGHLLNGRFLKDLGVNKKHAAISKSNLISMKAKAGFENRVYEEGRYIKILGWNLWKGIPISPPKLVDQVLSDNK
ncbi:MAG: hypothetical protein JRJ39_17150 [Deltaproteobacteria bacterium]|nr:hypothetical protein [Deltaproteobacteria bacterium]